MSHQANRDSVLQAEVVHAYDLSSDDESGVAKGSLLPAARHVSHGSAGDVSSAAGIPLYKGEDFGTDANATFVTRGYKDVWAIPAFLLVAAAVVATGAYSHATTERDPEAVSAKLVPFACAVVHSAVASVGVFVLALWAMKTSPVTYIHITQGLVVVLCVVLALLCFKAGSMFACGLNLFFAVLSAAWAASVRDRVPFAALILHTSVSLNLRHWGSFVVGAASLVCMIAFAAAWGLTVDFINTQLSTPQDHDALDESASHTASQHQQHPFVATLAHVKLHGIIWFGLVFVLFWAAQVCANVVHVTASGVVATWYFVGEQRMPRTAVPANLKRAMTTSFGSICFGSAVVALLKTIYYFLRMAVRSSRHEVVRLIAMCLLGVIERLTEMFNIYAFTQVAIYGHDFVTAAKQTFALVKESGWSLVINDCLAWNSMAITNVFGSFLICAAFWAASGPMAGFVSLMVATATFTIFFRPVYAGVATQFVCVAENPDAMSVANPEYGAAMKALKGGPSPTSNGTRRFQQV